MTQDTPMTEHRTAAPITSGQDGGRDGAELPDAIRVPLHELQADAAYLFGRVSADGSTAGRLAYVVGGKLSALEAGIREVLAHRPAASPPLAAGQDGGREWRREGALVYQLAEKPGWYEKVNRIEITVRASAGWPADQQATDDEVERLTATIFDAVRATPPAAQEPKPEPVARWWEWTSPCGFRRQFNRYPIEKWHRERGYAEWMCEPLYTHPERPAEVDAAVRTQCPMEVCSKCGRSWGDGCPLDEEDARLSRKEGGA